MTILSICTDMALLRSRPELDDEVKGKILNVGGTNIFYSSNNQSMVCLSGIAGLESLAELPEVTLTDYEAVFGFTQALIIDDDPQYDEDGEPIMEVVPFDPVMRLLYDTVYPRTPITIDGETYTPPLLVGIPGGYKTDHLRLSS